MKNKLLVVLLSFSLVFFPVRNGNAFLPALAVALSYTATGATLTAGLETALIYGAALVGVTAGFFVMTAPDGSKVAIPTVSGAAGAVPPPSAPATAPLTSVWTWTQGPGTCPGGASGARHTGFTSSSAALADFAATANTEPLCSPQAYSYSSTGTSICSKPTVGAPYCYFPNALTSASVCPAGYAAAGSSCTLTDARLVTQDKRQDVSRNGNVMSVTLGDLHGALSANILTTTTSNDTVSIAGTGKSGQPTQTNFIATPSGTTVLQNTQLTDSAGTPYVQTQTLTLNGGGTVTNVSQFSSNSSLQPDPAHPSLFVPVANPLGSIPAAPAAAGAGFPNDYARSGEAAAAAASTNAKLDTIHNDLSGTASVGDPLAVDTASMPSFGSTFDRLKSWNLPAHASTCPAPDIDLSGVFGAGHVYHLNAHCQIIKDHFAALQAAMMVAWSLLAMFVVLRA